MMTVRKVSFHGVIATLLLLATTPLVAAQDAPGVTVNVAGGVAPLAGAVKERLKYSGAVTGGVGYRFSDRFSESVQVSYFKHRVTQRLLDEAAVPDGNAHTWAITLDPRFNLFKSSKLPYLVGGVGYYRRTVEFTNPILINTIAFDPFFDVFYRVSIPSNQILSQSTASGLGGSLGGGLDFKLQNGMTVFGEVRFHRANTGRVHTDMVPAMIGVRW